MDQEITISMEMRQQKEIDIPSLFQKGMCQKGVSIQDLANLTGKSYETVKDWILGKSRPDIESFVQIIDFFGQVSEIFPEHPNNTITLTLEQIRKFAVEIATETAQKVINGLSTKEDTK